MKPWRPPAKCRPVQKRARHLKTRARCAISPTVAGSFLPDAGGRRRKCRLSCLFHLSVSLFADSQCMEVRPPAHPVPNDPSDALRATTVSAVSCLCTSAVERAGLGALNEAAKVSYEEMENRGNVRGKSAGVGYWISRRTSLSFLGASARSIARSASRSASALVAACPVQAFASNTNTHFQSCRPIP